MPPKTIIWNYKTTTCSGCREPILTGQSCLESGHGLVFCDEERIIEYHDALTRRSPQQVIEDSEEDDSWAEGPWDD